MTKNTITSTIENGHLVIRCALGQPAPSKSGKCLLVASTGGFLATTAVVNGKPVSLSLNATIPVS